MSTPASSLPPAPPTVPPASSKRRPALLALVIVFALSGLGYGLWWALHGRYHQQTDDAYVAGNIVQVTPQVIGTVVAVQADDGDFVQAGAPLISLERTDGKLALARAEGQLAQTVREVRGIFVTTQALQAGVRVRDADVARANAETARLNSELARAKTELNRAQDDYQRRNQLADTGAVAGEEIEHALAAVTNAEQLVATAGAAVITTEKQTLGAQEQLNNAREQLQTNRVMVDGTKVENHPQVARAAAAVREAFVALARTVVKAPVSGFVAKRSVQAGQRVQPGAPLMAIVPLKDVWVDANFKEVQLREMRVGQPVVLHSDLYGTKVEYHGRVSGFAPGTGAAFALLPPQNATGNWIKVVQRIPVRVALDAQEVEAHPLRVGLSMSVDVDVHEVAGSSLTTLARSGPVVQTQVFDEQEQGADERVRAIISANLRQ